MPVGREPDESTDEPRSRVAELLASGRHTEAIALLTDANRRNRDPDVEGMLVSLRHEAFLALPAQPPPPFTAVTAADGSDGRLSPTDPADLDVERLREDFAYQGCVLIRGLVPPERVADLVSGIDHSFEALDAGLAGAPVDETKPWYVPFKPRRNRYRVGGRRNWMRAGGAMWTADSPRMTFELLDLIEDLGIGELITNYLHERPALSANKCTLRRVPATNTAADWHQDGAFLGEQVRSVNFWLSLSHCGRDAPGMDIVPRRVDGVLQPGTEGAIFDWSVSPALVAEAAAGISIVRPEFEPGDALLFDHLFLHRTAAEPSMIRERYAMETWFFAPSTYPDGQIPLLY